jgi:hypothetical protein
MIEKNIKIINSSYGNNFFIEIKCSFLIFYYSSMFYNDTMVPISPSSPKIFLNKNSPMFYSSSNDDKNYVILLVIPKTITR